MSKIKESTDVDTQNTLKKNFNESFLNKLIKNVNTETNGRRYNKEVKKFATTLYFYSPKAYHYLRYLYHLIYSINI